MSDPTPQPPARKRATGRTLGLSDQQLDEAATVTPADVDSARDWWAKYAPKRLRGLLDAKAEHDA